VRDVPIGFEFATIIMRKRNQEVRPAKTNEKKKDANEVFVRRSLLRIAHDSFHAATSEKLHPTVELTGRREFIQSRYIGTDQS